MQKLMVDPEDIHSGNLILVNQTYPLARKNTEKDMNLTVIDERNSQILLEKRTATMFLQIVKDLKCGGEIVLISGYRSLKEQQQIYADSIATNGEEFTAKYVALPNRSEHQTGLAIDLAKKQEKIDFIRPFFPYTGICQEFREKAIGYGFVERYPKGKEKITGIAHEPWHFRYVGYPHSEIMQKEGLTLEEYIQVIQNYSYQEKHLTIKKQNQEIEIFYVKASPSLQTTIEVPETALHQISGNNVDGFIVTLWRKIV